MSNEERREVARKLRAIPHVDYFGYDSINPTDLWRTIGFLRTVDGRIPTAEVRYLADLIDRPTTSIDANKHGRAFCVNCGCDDWCLADGNARFCPKCGMEIKE